jgi:methylmalonyl-CoA mutase
MLKKGAKMSLDVRGEFPLPTPDEWRREADRLLKGAPFDKVLLTETYDGLVLEPIYDASVPPSGFDPALLNRGPETGWDVAQSLPYPSAKAFNEALRADLMRGLNTVPLRIDSAGVRGLDRLPGNQQFVGLRGTSISNLDDLRTALDGVDLTACPIRIEAGNSTCLYLPLLVALAAEQGVKPGQLHGTVAMDPLGAALTGCPLPRKWAWDAQADMLRWALDNKSPMRVVRVSGLPYAEAGSGSAQEIAYTLAAAVETIHQLTERGFAVDDIVDHMEFAVGLGPQFFAEIAKLRALRMVWAEILKQFGGKPANLFLHAATVRWNKTAYDPWVNLLRVVTEALSGVTGGADSLEVTPFDVAVRLPDEFSRRLARNLHAIFCEESEMHRVVDPAGGSHLIEALTRKLADKTLEMLGAIEDAGGMEAFLETGKPQAAVVETAARRRKNAHSRKDVFVGLNMFPNLQEKPLDIIPPAMPEFLAASSKLDSLEPGVDGMVEAYRKGATIGAVSARYHAHELAPRPIAVLDEFRVVSELETLRHDVQAHPEPLKVFLAGMGPAAQFKPRMDFSAGFFAVGGFKVITSKGFASTDDAARAALDSGAGIVVLCSTDDTYPELVPPFVKSLKTARPDVVAVLAGFPKDQVEAHKAAGIDEFIHIRSDVCAVLSALAKGVRA